MGDLLLSDVDDGVLQRLQERARRHRRSPAEEARAILAEALTGKRPDAWASVDEIYCRQAASDRTFSDSADLLRDDRDR
jgi:plasmid stability protein